MFTQVIYDGTTLTDLVNETIPFSGGKFFFATPIGYDESIYFEFGFVCVLLIPTLSGIQEKIINTSGQDLLDTDRIYRIPTEVSESEFNAKIYFYTTEPYNIRFYLIGSDVTLESVAEQINQLQEQNSQTIEQILNLVRGLILDPTLFLPISTSPINTLNQNDYPYILT